MNAHVRRVETLLSPTGLWDTGFQFGDWLDPTAPPENPILAKADNGVVATACLYRSATLVAEAAALLGRSEDQEHLRSWPAARGPPSSSTTSVPTGGSPATRVTVYALAIVFGLLEGEQRRLAGERLVELVAEGGYRIQTGFAGTPFVTDALTTHRAPRRRLPPAAASRSARPGSTR